MDRILTSEEKSILFEVYQFGPIYIPRSEQSHHAEVLWRLAGEDFLAVDKLYDSEKNWTASSFSVRDPSGTALLEHIHEEKDRYEDTVNHARDVKRLNRMQVYLLLGILIVSVISLVYRIVSDQLYTFLLPPIN